MARRVYFHVGTPKTGTTFLQTLLWHHRAALREQGVLFPGERRQDHLYASYVVRDDPAIAGRSESAPSAWRRLVDEVRAWEGTAIISHEFFGPATAEQAGAAVTAVAPAEVHIVVTARECVGLLTGYWQEYVKHRYPKALAEFGRGRADDPRQLWDWRAMDAADVLSRWTTTVPPTRAHVIPMPTDGAPPDELWRRFCAVTGIAAESVDTSVARRNESLGVVEVELLRRVTPHLHSVFDKPSEVGTWVRGYLSHQVLAARGGERFAPGPEQLAAMRAKSTEIVDAIRVAGYQVEGSLDELLTPDHLPERTTPDQVTAEQMLTAATETIAVMLKDLRSARLRRDEWRSRAREAERRLASAGVTAGRGDRLRRLTRKVRRADG